MRLDMNRDVLRAAIFLTVFTLILFGVNILFTARETAAVRASVAAAQRAEASTLQLCRAGNEARAQQAGLWNYLIHLSKPPPDAQGRATLAKFERHLHVVFAPRDCSRPLTLGH